jgi:membrane-associated phospholipid phosphatase
MIILWPFEIPIILVIQNLGNWLEVPMRFFSFLGQEEFFLLVMSALYWCIDPALGVRVAFALLISNNINGYIKTLFHGTRPYWLDQSIVPYGDETSFGFPSNHAQTAAVVWGRIALDARKNWMKWLFILIIFLIGFSRLYLGVHFLSDVIGGWILGTILLFIIIKLEKRVSLFWFSKSLLFQVILSIILPIVFLSIGLLVISTSNSWQIPPEWITNALRADPDIQITPWDPSGLYTISGLLFGMLAGISWLKSRGGYKVTSNQGKLLLCYLIGIAGVLFFWYGLGLIFPRSEDILGNLLRYFRYTLVGLWISALAPMLFIQLKIGNKLD